MPKVSINNNKIPARLSWVSFKVGELIYINENEPLLRVAGGLANLVSGVLYTAGSIRTDNAYLRYETGAKIVLVQEELGVN